MSELAALPLCVAGDSFAAGLGDEGGLGWTGRLVQVGVDSGFPLHVSACGIRGDTSERILARWDEVDRRVESWPETAVIAEFGVNDVMTVDGAERVDVQRTRAALRGICGRAPAGRFLVVGPPPIAFDDVEQRIDPATLVNERIFARSAVIDAECAAAGVPFVSTFGALLGNEVWMREVATYDGAHPGGAGYAEFARVVSGPILEWARSLRP